MKKSITHSNLKDLSVLLLTYGFLKPKIVVSKFTVISDLFMSKYFSQIKIDYALIENTYAGCYENILELMTDNNVVIGFIKTTDFNEKEILNNISKLKPVLFNKIQIPLLTVQTKLKLKNVFFCLCMKGNIYFTKA